MEETIIELAKQLNEIAPHVWQVVMRQVYVEALSKLCWALLWATLAVVSFRVKDRLDILVDNDNQWVAVAISIVLGIAAFGLIISSIMWISNPEFYAIRWLIQQVTP